MTVLEALAVLVAGAVAGGVNTVVGSGSLITFPTLLAVGYAPVTANVSNCVGLVPGGVAGSFGYRRELRGQWRRCGILAIGTTIGAVIGGILLLELPDAVFDAIVPALILLAVALMALRPSPKIHEGGDNMAAGVASSFAVGIYGGYFGAAQGILLMAFLGILLDEQMQRLNAVKNVLAGLVNAVAAVVFVLASEVAWDAVAVIAIGSTIGGQLGGVYGRRLPPDVLRGIIVVVGTTAAVRLLVT